MGGIKMSGTSKYRGKYKKSRSCVNAVEPLMQMVIVADSCPYGTQYSSAIMVDKRTCEVCDEYKVKGAEPIDANKR
jgi:hypothetical protein